MDPLDATDSKLVALLQNDGRASNKELAASIGLSPSSTHYRMQRLLQGGVVRGIHADVDPRALGIGLQAMISLRLQHQSKDAMYAMQDYLLGLREVVAVYHVSGADDFLVHVVARDTEHLRDLVMDALSGRPELANLSTALLFEHRRRHSLPDLREG